MARLGTRTMILKIGGTDMSLQVSNVELNPTDSDPDFYTFGDVAAGNDTSWVLSFTAAQDMATGTLWDKVWTSAGTSVAYVLLPYGNATASASQPSFSGNAVIKYPSGNFIGGDVDKSTTNSQTFACEWPCDAKPTKAVS